MIESEKQPPASKKTPHSFNQLRPNAILGQSGEDQAALFLQNHHFEILARNFRSGHGEIDLIAWDQATKEIVFVEVKTRGSSYYGDPSQAVGHAKLKSLIKVARAWLKENHCFVDFRFDGIAITPTAIRHDRNLTW